MKHLITCHLKGGELEACVNYNNKWSSPEFILPRNSKLLHVASQNCLFHTVTAGLISDPFCFDWNTIWLAFHERLRLGPISKSLADGYCWTNPPVACWGAVRWYVISAPNLQSCCPKTPTGTSISLAVESQSLFLSLVASICLIGGSCAYVETECLGFVVRAPDWFLLIILSVSWYFQLSLFVSWYSVVFSPSRF